jgi:hypothetical protein
MRMAIKRMSPALTIERPPITAIPCMAPHQLPGLN